MGTILSTYLLPHPPILIPEVGRGEEKKAQATLDAMEKCAGHIQDKGYHTII